MGTLIDTHTLVWFAWDMVEPPATIKYVLEDPSEITRVSIASF